MGREHSSNLDDFPSDRSCLRHSTFARTHTAIARKMSENNLQLQDQLTLESLSRLDLVGNVIHELNNPLNFISASSIGLKEHGKRLKKIP